MTTLFPVFQLLEIQVVQLDVDSEVNTWLNPKSKTSWSQGSLCLLEVFQVRVI